MIFKRTLILGALLASLGVSAQMPVPVLDTDTQAKAAAEATVQLEASLLCKKGTKFLAADVESQFRALGLVKGRDTNYLPTRKDAKIMLLNNELLAASVSDSDGEKKVSVYLKGQTGKQLATKMGVTHVDEFADSDAVVYSKQTSKKTASTVGEAAVLYVEMPDKSDRSIRYSATVQCQLLK